MPENFGSNTLTSRYTTGIKLLNKLKFRTKEKFLQTEVKFFFLFFFGFSLGKFN